MRGTRRSLYPTKVVSPVFLHYIAEVGEDMALAYRRLDDTDWPYKQLVKMPLRELAKFDSFLTAATQRRGVKINGGVILLRGDGTAEERFDVHESLMVLA
jgi:hypothetical protein